MPEAATIDAPAEAPRQSRRLRGGRAVAFLALVAGGVWLLANPGEVRAVEAIALARASALLLDKDVFISSWSTAVFWNPTADRVQGLYITTQCSAVLVVGPLMVLSGALCIWKRLPLRRVFIGAAVGITTFLMINLSRMVAVAWVRDRSTSERSAWLAHSLGGSIVSVLGAALAMGLIVFIVFGDRRARQAAG
jgi:exosortase/archaeosortase family protein